MLIHAEQYFRTELSHHYQTADTKTAACKTDYRENNRITHEVSRHVRSTNTATQVFNYSLIDPVGFARQSPKQYSPSKFWIVVMLGADVRICSAFKSSLHHRLQLR